MLSVHRMRTDWPVAYVGLSCCCTQRMPRMSELQTAQRALTRQPFVDINNALRDVQTVDGKSIGISAGHPSSAHARPAVPATYLGDIV